MEKIIEIKNIYKSYGDVKAVNGISFELEKGDVFGFIGPNGAGKSTTIRLIMNLIKLDSGSILFYGKPFTKREIELKKYVGYCPSEISLYGDLTVKQMFDFHKSYYKDCQGIDEKLKYLVDKLELDENKKIENLSLGNLKKVGIILALMHSPKLVIFDEATSGLDPIIQRKFFEILNEEKKSGTTILYSTHILSEVSKICDKVAIIKEGKIIKCERVSDLIKKSLVLVTIMSNEIENIKGELNADYILDTPDTIKFAWKNDINELLKVLTKYNLQKLIIEESTIEDLFLHYYQKED